MALTLVRVKVGPWGGTGGSAWDEGGHDASGGSYTGIRSMAIGSSWCVDSMLFEYDDNGKPVKGSLYGEENPGAQEELDFPGEFLTHVSGYHDNYLRSLQFRSNRNRTFGPYGAKNINNEDWSPFEVSMEGAGSIVGFSGRSGNSINAIGVYIAVWSPQRFYDKMQTQDVVAYRTSPLHLQLRALHEVEQQKREREEEERQRIQKVVQEQWNLEEELRMYLDDIKREREEEERQREEEERQRTQKVDLEEELRMYLDDIKREEEECQRTQKVDLEEELQAYLDDIKREKEERQRTQKVVQEQRDFKEELQTYFDDIKREEEERQHRQKVVQEQRDFKEELQTYFDDIKREEEERQHRQKVVQEQRDLEEELRAYLDDIKKDKSWPMFKLKQQEQIQVLEELVKPQQRERQRLRKEIRGQQERLRTLQALHKGHGRQAQIETERLQKLQQDLHSTSDFVEHVSQFIKEMKRQYHGY
ncbi:hypothetical protein E2562_038298 [Oryza meyeriana var. granulata]|uniref:Jacalin-type lectin domain-containing protein n=1 Tax=Oryza meyeriana var. granulata TaxID=110450 RepID=A0A6G1EU93_9ORYZ|nr:hypothetical protein E2562_038298 [Oryza meyeriana var. granulata]